MKKHLIFSTTLLILFGMFATEGLANKNKDIWSPFRFFLGQWKGHGEGMSGVSEGQMEFGFILQGQYLHVTNKSVFAPQEKNPEGEIHEDWGLFSYDRNRNTFVLRQFHVEGFVNQYILESLSEDEKTFVFSSEKIENGPQGLEAKLVYEILSEDEFKLSFFLAMPEREMTCYSTGILKKKSDGKGV